MKSIWKSLSMFVVVAAVATSCCGSSSELSREDAALDVIMTRSSVRSYTSQAVEDEKIEKMLRAAMAAPTAANKQPWEYVVITDRAILDSLPSITGGMKMAAKAPLAIAVCGVPSKSIPKIPEFWIQDCSASTQNLLLAAHAMGLGAVWCGTYPEDGTDRVGRLSRLLNLPEGVYALSVSVIGYPDSEAKPKDKWKAEKVHYNNQY